MHQVVHVVALVVFLAGVSLGFLGLARPLFDDGQQSGLLGRRMGFMCLAASGGALGLDWLFHHF